MTLADFFVKQPNALQLRSLTLPSPQAMMILLIAATNKLPQKWTTEELRRLNSHRNIEEMFKGEFAQTVSSLELNRSNVLHLAGYRENGLYKGKPRRLYTVPNMPRLKRLAQTIIANHQQSKKQTT